MAWYDAGEPVSIGHGVTILPQHYEGEVVGLNEGHLTPEGVGCGGWVSFEGQAWQRAFEPEAEKYIPSWTVVSWEPLTLTPSILCRSCGHHGFITDGEWVPA